MASKEDWTDPRLAPLLRKNFQGLPPALFVVAEYDPLRDDSYGKGMSSHILYYLFNNLWRTVCGIIFNHIESSCAQQKPVSKSKSNLAQVYHIHPRIWLLSNHGTMVAHPSHCNGPRIDVGLGLQTTMFSSIAAAIETNSFGFRFGWAGSVHGMQLMSIALGQTLGWP